MPLLFSANSDEGNHISHLLCKQKCNKKCPNLSEQTHLESELSEQQQSTYKDESIVQKTKQSSVARSQKSQNQQSPEYKTGNKKHNIQDNLKFSKVNFYKQKVHCLLLSQLTNGSQDLTRK